MSTEVMKAKMVQLGKLMAGDKREPAIALLREIMELVSGDTEEEKLQRGLLLRDQARLTLELEKEEEGVQLLERSAQVLRGLTSSNTDHVRQTSLLHLSDLEVSLAVRQQDEEAKIEGIKRAIVCAQTSCFLLKNREQRKIQLGAVMHKQNVLISLLVPLERYREAANITMQMSFSMLKEGNLKELGINLVRVSALWEQQGLLEESEVYLTLAARALKHAEDATHGQAVAAGIYLDDFRGRYPDKPASTLEERSRDEPNQYCVAKVYCSKAGLLYWTSHRHVFATADADVFSCPLSEMHKAEEQLAALAKQNGIVWLYSDEEVPEDLLALIHKHQVSIWHCTRPFRLEQSNNTE